MQTIEKGMRSRDGGIEESELRRYVKCAATWRELEEEFGDVVVRKAAGTDE
jgi:hypothetical protein